MIVDDEQPETRLPGYPTKPVAHPSRKMVLEKVPGA
jgi:hypothetical protein